MMLMTHTDQRTLERLLTVRKRGEISASPTIRTASTSGRRRLALSLRASMAASVDDPGRGEEHVLLGDDALGELLDDPPLAQDDDAGGEARQLRQVGGHDDDRDPLARQPLDLVVDLLL